MPEAVNLPQLMANLAKFYREALRRSKAGRAVAAGLGLHDHQVLERFQAGYADGTLSRAIPSKGGVRDALRESGLLAADGAEVAKGSLMIPATDEHENVLGFVAMGKDAKEGRYPASMPLWRVNWEAFKEKAVIFTDTAVNALLFAQAGHLNAVPMGSEVPEDARALIERHRPGKAYVAADLPELLRLLQKIEVPCFRLSVGLPAAPEAVEQAVKGAEPIGAKVGPDAVVRVADDAVRFECGGRRYELRELAPGETDRMRVRIKAQGEARFHLDTLDLYAGRSRTAFARVAAPIFGVSEDAVADDLCLMIGKLEAMRRARSAQAESSDGRYVMTPDEEAEALEFLKRPDLLDRIVADMQTLGYVGEKANKRIGYLISISRKLDNPLCGVIISRAAAGKSRLLDLLAELVPPEDLVSYTRITPQALYYAANRGLKNKLLVSGEDEGLFGSDYALRELISSKRIRLAAPVRDTATGKMKTADYEVEGPIALLFSTTRPAIHYENSTRCFVLSLDESNEQTERVMRFQLERKSLDGIMRTLEGRALRRLHRNAQRLLRPLVIVNPLAGEARFPVHRIESRREHEKYLSLVEAIAFLKQHQREIKRLPSEGREVEYIEITREDVAEADKLMSDALAGHGDELSGPSRKLLELIWQMVRERSQELDVDLKVFQFNRRDIREYTGWSDNQIKAHIKRLEELQYLTVRSGDRGKMYRYELAYTPERPGGHGQAKTSCQPVGYKLPVDNSASSVGERPTSWEVGQDSGKGYRGMDKERVPSHA